MLLRVSELMGTLGRPWALCGGWAVDAWLGRVTREHLDVDLSVFEEDQAAGQDLNLDVQLNRRDGGDLVLRDAPRLAMPMSRAIGVSAWGLPTLAPEAILYFKSLGEPRRHDQADVELLRDYLASGSGS